MKNQLQDEKYWINGYLIANEELNYYGKKDGEVGFFGLSEFEDISKDLYILEDDEIHDLIKVSLSGFCERPGLLCEKHKISGLIKIKKNLKTGQIIFI